MQAGVPHQAQQQAAAKAEALQRARFALQNQRPLEAERLAGEILKEQPGHTEAAKIAGYAMLMQGRAQDAVAPLEKIARGSHDPEIATQLAIALRQTGRSDDALLWLKRAVKRKPPFAAAFHELGFVLYSLQRYDEAIAVLKQGIDAAPMMTEMPIQLGNVYYAMLDRANAGRSFARALSINPNHSEAIHGLASVLIDAGDFVQAAELLKRAVSANPGDAQARLGLASCLLELGQADAAYACLRAATRGGPQYYGMALNTLLSSGHGRFWLKPSVAAKFIKGDSA